MADIEPRKNAAGKLTSYRARWRVKIDGKAGTSRHRHGGGT